jgi:hypothetical protein
MNDCPIDKNNIVLSNDYINCTISNLAGVRRGTWAYVDVASTGEPIEGPVPKVIDGQTINDSTVILLKDQTPNSVLKNGIYTSWTTDGNLTLLSDLSNVNYIGVKIGKMNGGAYYKYLNGKFTKIDKENKIVGSGSIEDIVKCNEDILLKHVFFTIFFLLIISTMIYVLVLTNQ